MRRLRFWCRRLQHVDERDRSFVCFRFVLSFVVHCVALQDVGAEYGHTADTRANARYLI